MNANNEAIFELKDYSVVLTDSDGRVLPVVERVNLAVKKGCCLGLAGESGSGKSVLVSSSLGLIPKSIIKSQEGSVWFNGSEIKDYDELYKLMGRHIGFVFQEPMTAMNPLMTLYEQISETVEAHMPELDKNKVREKTIDALKRSGFGEPEKFLNSYPHQLSGGMRQRAMIAMAIVLEPELIIADEPTTAIDAELQVQILGELRKRIDSENCGMIFISHDLGVMRAISDELAILYCGCIVEKGPTEKVLTEPRHPYTKALINALPRLISERRIPEAIPGNMPSADKKISGCAFAPRCKRAEKKCFAERPLLRQVDEKHFIACYCE